MLVLVCILTLGSGEDRALTKIAGATAIGGATREMLHEGASFALAREEETLRHAAWKRIEREESRDVAITYPPSCADDPAADAHPAAALRRGRPYIRPVARSLMQEIATMERVPLTSYDEVLSGIAHELKTPLTTIRSFSEILRDNPDLPDDERQRFLAIVLEESERLHRRIERMLDC